MAKALRECCRRNAFENFLNVYQHAWPFLDRTTFTVRCCSRSLGLRLCNSFRPCRKLSDIDALACAQRLHIHTHKYPTHTLYARIHCERALSCLATRKVKTKTEVKKVECLLLCLGRKFSSRLFTTSCFDFSTKFRKFARRAQNALGQSEHLSLPLNRFSRRPSNSTSLGCVYTYTDSEVSGYPGRRYPGKCKAFTRIQISGAVVRHACAMRYQHDLRPSFEGQSCLAVRYLSGFSVIHES